MTIFVSGGLDEDSLVDFSAARRADRRHRHRHEPHHVLRRAGDRLRLQAPGICRHAAAQKIAQQGDLAGPQTGVAAIRCRRPHGRRSVGAGRATGRRRAVVAAGHDRRPPLAAGGPARHHSQPRRAELQRLPDAFRRLDPAGVLSAEVADDLVVLAAAVDRRLGKRRPSTAPARRGSAINPALGNSASRPNEPAMPAQGPCPPNQNCVQCTILWTSRKTGP